MEALPINISPALLNTLQHTFKYRWCTSLLKYLGVHLTPSYSSLYQANFPPMFTEITRPLNLWTPLPISFLCRINVLKMSTLPKLLYLFETLPIPVPLSQLKLLQRKCLKFIWNNASHRIARSVVYALKNRGGLAAPDIIKYYYASHLRVLSSWISRKAPSRWAEIEMGITAPVHPCYMLWPYSAKFMPQLRSLCLAPMLFTLAIWKRCAERFSLSSKCSPLFNPGIPDGLSYTRMLPWTQAGMFQLRHLVHPATRKLMSFSDLQTKYELPTSLLYSYIQFKHFFHSNSPLLSLEKPTDFETLCANGPYEPKQISSTTFCMKPHL